MPNSLDRSQFDRVVQLSQSRLDFPILYTILCAERGLNQGTGTSEQGDFQPLDRFCLFRPTQCLSDPSK